jgi:hypothetical protein
MRNILVICSFIFIFAGNVFADNCAAIRRPVLTGNHSTTVVSGNSVLTFPRTYSYPVHEVHVDEVFTPVVAIPVYIPTFQFQYQPPCVTPAAVATQQSAVMDDKERMKMLAQILREELKNEKNIQPKNEDLEDDLPPVAIDDEAVELPKINKPDFVSILKNKCARCHTSGIRVDGGMAIFNKDGSYNVKSNYNSILNSVRENRMPFGAKSSPDKRLTDAEKRILENAKS